MPPPDSPLDLGNGANVSRAPHIVNADGRRGTVSDIEDPAESIASRPKRTAKAPRRPTIETPAPKESPPRASLEKMRVGQSNKATGQIDLLSSDGIPAPPSSQQSPELSATVADLQRDTGAVNSIEEKHNASKSNQRASGHHIGSTTDSRSDTETIIGDPSADPEEQEASHNRTKMALLDVHKRKQEVEQQLRRVQTEYGQTSHDHVAGHETLEQKLQALVAHGEEQEAAHNKTRLALVEAHKEKHDAEQKLNRAVTQYRQRLQAVGIMAEDNAQPIWEVGSDGKQSRPLYKDFPNVLRESHVNLLISRANCRFMLGDYQGMATIAFGALEVTRRLKFQPLSARCQFIIGISFYHSRRFREAYQRFRLALGCKDRYGISTECVKRWLEKCEDSVAGDSSVNPESSVRGSHPRNTDRAVEFGFQADIFFARATNVASNLGSPYMETDADIEDVEGYTFCPSQGYDDESDEIKEVSNPGAASPGELLPERRHLVPSISPTHFSALPSQAIGQAGIMEIQPEWVDIPTSRSSDTASVPSNQLAPWATENPLAKAASRPRSSTSVDPILVEYSDAPFDFAEQNLVKARGRAVTNVEQKGAKGLRTGRLLGPLSWQTKDMENIPIQDIEAWANRSLEKRLQEAAKDQRQNRFPVAFILYRFAYADRIRNLYKGADHQFVSSLASESWRMELPKIREQYEEWATLERENHEKALRISTT